MSCDGKSVFMWLQRRETLVRSGLLTAFIMVSTPALAGMTVSDLRARPSLGAARNSIVWMTIRNDSGASDRLLRAESTVADRVELHTHVMEKRGDRVIMRMRPVPDIPVPARGEARLAPGGLHVMLIGVRRPLRPGDDFVLRLVFENAPSLEVTVPVLKLSATMGGHGRGGKTHVQAPTPGAGN